MLGGCSWKDNNNTPWVPISNAWRIEGHFLIMDDRTVNLSGTVHILLTSRSKDSKPGCCRAEPGYWVNMDASWPSVETPVENNPALCPPAVQATVKSSSGQAARASWRRTHSSTFAVSATEGLFSRDPRLWITPSSGLAAGETKRHTVLLCYPLCPNQASVLKAWVSRGLTAIMYRCINRDVYPLLLLR